MKIGIIIDGSHYKHKVSEFLKYLKSKAEVSIYLEETLFLDVSSLDFQEDVFFVKGKGPLLLETVRIIEKIFPTIPIINSHRSIWLAINRFMNSMLLQRAGIRVPRFTLNPSEMPPNFEDYIVKNIVDQKTYAFKAKIEKKDGHIHVKDERAINEAKGKENYQYLYYQEFIKSKWEYKIYGFGDNLYFYKQLPVLVNPNKMESRKKIDRIPELEEFSYKAMETIGLKISSLDFLQSNDGTYYLTDINSSPNFNYLKNGPQLVGDYLIKQAKR